MFLDLFTNPPRKQPAKRNLVKKVDWKKLQNDPRYKKYDWKINPKNLSILQDSLIKRNISRPQQIAIFSQVIPENGGNITPHGNGAFGILGYRGSRKNNLPNNLGGQIHKALYETFDNPTDWTHGGKGSGFNSGKEANNTFVNTNNVLSATNAFMKGYVRPPQSEYKKRQDFIELLKSYF